MRPAVRLAFKLTDYSGENLKAPRFLKVHWFRHVLSGICVAAHTNPRSYSLYTYSNISQNVCNCIIRFPTLMSCYSPNKSCATRRRRHSCSDVTALPHLSLFIRSYVKGRLITTQPTKPFNPTRIQINPASSE